MHIEVELKAIEQADTVGKAAGIPGESLLGGLIKLWHWCWSKERDVLSRGQLCGFFGGEIDRVIGALVDFEFLAPVDGGWRVRGAGRYLRIQEAKRAGGRAAAAAGNLRPGGWNKGKPKAQQSPAESPAGSPAPTPAGAQQEPSSYTDPPIHRSTERSDLAGSPVGDPPAKEAKGPDPGLKTLTERMVGIWVEERKAPYLHRGAADTQALKRVLKVAKEGTVLLLWRESIRSPDKWLRTNSFAELAAKFNALVDAHRRRSLA